MLMSRVPILSLQSRCLEEFDALLNKMLFCHLIRVTSAFDFVHAYLVGSCRSESGQSPQQFQGRADGIRRKHAQWTDSFSDCRFAVIVVVLFHLSSVALPAGRRCQFVSGFFDPLRASPVQLQLSRRTVASNG